MRKVISAIIIFYGAFWLAFLSGVSLPGHSVHGVTPASAFYAVDENMTVAWDCQTKKANMSVTDTGNIFRNAQRGNLIIKNTDTNVVQVTAWGFDRTDTAVTQIIAIVPITVLGPYFIQEQNHPDINTTFTAGPCPTPEPTPTPVLPPGPTPTPIATMPPGPHPGLG